MRNIGTVVDNNLCMGCGTCISFCNNNAIELSLDDDKGYFIPKLDQDSCNNCNICLMVCPGHKVDFEKLNLTVFGKNQSCHGFKKEWAGIFKNSYISFSHDKNIRYNSSSGGLITEILVYALENNIIDGALVTKMRDDLPTEPVPFIATTKDQILEASKSKYCPVPLNKSISHIKNFNGKLAVVGLPCHIHGIRKSEELYVDIKNKIVLHLGLFCDHTPSFHGSNFFFNKLNIKNKNISSIEYRGCGWPGKMRICKDGSEIFIDHTECWKIIGSYLFIIPRCLTCIDGLCEFADISVGDAWIPEISTDKNGISIALSRTEFGENILAEMKNNNKIFLEKISIKKVLLSQSKMLYFKKMDFYILKSFFRFNPQYNTKLIKTSIIDEIIMLFIFFNMFLGSKNFFRKILDKIPLRIINFFLLSYSFIYFLISKRFKKIVEIN